VLCNPLKNNDKYHDLANQSNKDCTESTANKRWAPRANLPALYDLGMSKTEGVYAGHTYAEPYLRIALKAEHKLKQTLALLVQLETIAAQQHQCQHQLSLF